MNWKCYFKHNFTKWKQIGKADFKDILKRRCVRCDKIEKYTGLTNVCIVTGEKTPYIFTN